MQRRVHRRNAAAKAVTLRSLSPELAQELRRRASQSGQSMNKTIGAVLEEALLGPRPKAAETVHHDLDWFFGSWSKEEAAEFDRALAEQRVIEPELWK